MMYVYHSGIYSCTVIVLRSADEKVEKVMKMKSLFMQIQETIWFPIAYKVWHNTVRKYIYFVHSRYIL